MILHIDGNISRYYVETLCMVFFPGSTFGENEEPGVGIPEVNISVYSDKEGSETAFVSIKLNDKNGIIHTTIGKVDFDADKLKENLEALLVALKKAKPTQAKGVYIKKVSISTTMGAGVAVDQAGLSASVN